MTSPSTALTDNAPELASATSSNAFSSRFLWVDAIRGLACMAVVARHLTFPLKDHPGLAALFPAWLAWLHMTSAAGVYAFFVLSGFVIAHSLRSNPLDTRSVGNFILRRQVRLDPVYWVALLLYSIGSAHFSAPNFAINAVYLQDILNKQEIIGPAWTLCIEIQFYLVFIAILFAGKFAPRIVPENSVTRFSVWTVFVTGVIALFLKFYKFESAYFFSYWHYFALGVLSYYAVNNAISLKTYGAFLFAFMVSLVCSPPQEIMEGGAKHSLALASMIVALATGVSLWYAGRSGKMGVWGSTPILQYLGRISYTLYLIHLLVISVLSRVFARFENEKWSSLGLYFLCVGVSIGVAHLLHLLVEKPTMKLSSRMRVSNLPKSSRWH